MNISTSPRELAVVACLLVAMLAAAYPLSHRFEGHQPNKRLARRNARRELWSLAVLFVAACIVGSLLMGGA